ncbi:MAG: hypothetical protein ACFFBI_08925 [Promethearchaeota archaeon]
MKSKVKILIATSILIGIIAIVSPAVAAGSNRFFFIARGDDMDLAATDFIVGSSKSVYFYSQLYDESGEKVYAMNGWTTNLELMTDQLTFYCPVCDVIFTDVLWIQGEGKFKTTDTDFPVFFRKSFMLTMPNTGGNYITTTIFMWINPTGRYYEYEGDPMDPENPPTPVGEVKIWPGGGWVLTGVFWDTGLPIDAGFGEGILPIGPVSYLTWYHEY